MQHKKTIKNILPRYLKKLKKLNIDTTFTTDPTGNDNFVKI